RLRSEARALADRACHLHIRHEVELRGNHAFALALFAAAALHVKAEPAGLILAFGRQRRAREEVADGVVEPDVRRRVRAAVPPDRRLIDVYYFVDVLGAFQSVMMAGQRARVNQPLPQRLVEDLADERALARSRCAGDGDHRAERKGYVQAL